MNDNFETPVLFLIFNRPETTKRVFEVIRQIKPKQLFVAADGPRKDRTGEKGKCEEAKQIVKVDWECKINTLYREDNLGCKRAVSSSIDWFFKQVDRGIILEDDCLPDLTFFKFCEELLEYYKDDKRISMIGGAFFGKERMQIPYSYYFSKCFHIWGWASWRRAWNSYDLKMEKWGKVKNTEWLEKNLHSNRRNFKYWNDAFEGVYSGRIDTWDYQWVFSCMLNDTLSIIPKYNLVRNIGFGKDSTHTSEEKIPQYIKGYVEKMEFPLIHPDYIVRSFTNDSQTNEEQFSELKFVDKVYRKMQRILKV